MLSLPHTFQLLLAAGHGESLGTLIIIVLLVVGRIIKEVLERRADRSYHEPSEDPFGEPYVDPGPAEDPVDPLRRFLQDLQQQQSGGRVSTPPPLPTRSPPAPRHAAPSVPAQSGRRRIVRPAVRRPPPPVRRPASARTLPAAEPDKVAHKAPSVTPAKANPAQQRLLAMLSSSDRQRDAILLREVLGPPLALRHDDNML